jgi:hypothetical protein
MLSEKFLVIIFRAFGAEILWGFIDPGRRGAKNAPLGLG